MKNVIFETVIGSHLWKMNNRYSDIDLFQVFVSPTKDILRGTEKSKSKHTIVDSPTSTLCGYPFNGKIDTMTHEIGTVIYQLIKGNINFLIGVLSPLTVMPSPWLRTLRQLVVVDTNTLCYHSIRGMATHNYDKYIKSGKDTSAERCMKIGRYLNFGYNLFTTGKYIFDIPSHCDHPFEVECWIQKLDEAYLNSDLPVTVNEEEFRDFLLEIRLEYLEK